MSYPAHSKSSPFVFALLSAIVFVNLTQAQLSVPFQPRLPGGNIKVKGDMVFVANNIVSIGTDPNQAYNGSLNNDSQSMKYIDIDGDPTTFSSSSAELNAPSCSAIVYAGLYWGGIYREETNRGEAYKSVKFKVPGGSYIEIGPHSGPEFNYSQIYDKDGDRDGDGSTDPGILDVDFLNGQNMTSYMNYAEVTHLLSALPDPNGAYTVADVVASVGMGNTSAGWNMVVIYQNMNSTSKYISTFDGFAAMDQKTNAIIPVSGFRTLPGALPVNAMIGAGAIDGDRSAGPSLRFRANPGDPWAYLEDAINPRHNVFNSTISHLGSWVDTRNPASHNTLGWDADIMKLKNPGNTVLPNNHDRGEIWIKTTGEGVYLFLATMAVEIITPEVIVEKKVYDSGGNDITGAGVNLGQSLQYVLRFWNRGNDDAEEFSIRDILPENVSLDQIDLSGAPGTTLATDPLNPREVIFDIPDNLVQKGGSKYEIRIRVEVSDNCHDFVDACSRSIDNTAYYTYTGVTTGQLISDDPSVSNVNACGIVTPGATNFLMDDLSNCTFEWKETICGDRAQLTAGAGYDSYTWYRDQNKNGQVDATDPVYHDSDPDNDPKTITVQETGQYLVVKESASCGTTREIVLVDRFGTTQTNPILNFFNSRNGDADLGNDIQGEVVTCPNDGSPLPKIFLCGTNDSQEIILDITDTSTISWEKLVEGSCPYTGADCPNNQMNCQWNDFGSGNSFKVDQAGRYRVTLAYDGGCSSIFYFDVFQNELDFSVDSQDIYCATDGFIRIQGLSSSYGFQLVDTQSGSVVVPYSAHHGADFTIATEGTYRVDFTQMDPETGTPLMGSCVFSSGEITIKDRDLDLDLFPEPVTCKGQGSVRIQANGVRGTYNYYLYEDDGSEGPGKSLGELLNRTENDITFDTLNPGDYMVRVTTPDGCNRTEAFTIAEIPNPVVTATVTRHISCDEGVISLNASEGFPNPEYTYAIWSKNGTTTYTDITDIDPTEYQRDIGGVFTFAPGEEGIYKFVVVDGNNCWSISKEVTLSNLGPLTLPAPTVDSEIVCEGSNTGQITMNPSGAEGPYSYSKDNWATSQADPTFTNLAPGTYTLRVRSSDGCEQDRTVTLEDPETLRASAGISSTGTCDALGNTEVRFTNVEGGTAPYEFSFDGGENYVMDGPGVRTSMLPPGSHILMVRDVRGCTVTLPIAIDPLLPVPKFNRDLDYDCNGNGLVDLRPDQTIYDYHYSLNTIPATSSTDGTFTGIVPGSYTITATYTENDPPSPSVLLHEDFGSGPTVDSRFTQGYTYEDQVGSGPQINDFEYTVTSRIAHPFGNWLQPKDHTSGGTDPTGRYLVINVGSPSPGQVIYKKPVRDIIPHQDMRVSFAAMNLLDGPNSQLDPDLWVQMRIPGTTGTDGIVGEVQTGNITRNYQWNTYEFTLNPGVHTELDFELVSRKIGNNGNDVAIDDILVEQVPQSCPRTVTIPVEIEGGKAFRAEYLSHTDISCHGANDGSITFEVKNFDPVQGFEYSVDGGTSWVTSTTSKVTTAKTLAPGLQRVTVRKVGESACSIDMDQQIDEPTPLAIVPNILQQPTCIDETSGSISATVSGGSPNYSYSLQDGAGNELVPFPNPNGAVFSGLAAGDYIILATDSKGCEISSTTITLDPPGPVTFTATGTTCYDGTNSATITLNVQSGNGGYLFQIDNGTWESPVAPASGTHTFTGLANGSYTVNVKDAFGCEGTAQTITIDPQLVVSFTRTHVSSCNAGTVAVTASGGDGNLVYALVPSGTLPVAMDFQVSPDFVVDNTLALGNPGGFDLHVRDNLGTGDYCEFIHEEIIIQPMVDLELNVTEEDPNCHGGNGSVLVELTKADGTALSPTEISQTGPYTYTVLHEGTVLGTVENIGHTQHTFHNLAHGTYEIQVTDGLGCPLTKNHIHITDPPVLTAAVKSEFPDTGACDFADGFSFYDFPDESDFNGSFEFGYNDGNWQDSPVFNDPINLSSGTNIYPTIRVVDAGGNVLCRYDLDRYTLTYPLDDLDITIAATVDFCNELKVTVQGSEGASPYVYAYSEDPVNFDPNNPTIWTDPPQGQTDPYLFENLMPGRTYVFYVKDDSGCVRQSTVNVNELEAVDLPIEISAVVTPNCAGEDNGSISFTLEPDTNYPQMRWELFEVGNSIPVQASGPNPADPASNVPYVDEVVIKGLAEGDYYLAVTQVDGSGNDQCHAGSENVEIREQRPITAVVTAGDEIGCVRPGTILVTNIDGGTGPYTFHVAGPGGFTIPETTQNPIEIPAGSPSGNYQVTIFDTYGCSPNTSYPVTMAENEPPTLAVAVDNCSDNIEVTLTGSAGAGNYRYAMVASGSPAPTTFLDNGGEFLGVAPGTYEFYVIDTNGCTAFQPLTVNPTLKAKATRTKLLDCGPTAGASIEIEVLQGFGTMTYSVREITSPGPIESGPITGNHTFTTVVPGTYEIKVNVAATAEHRACERTFEVIVPDRILPEFTATATDVSCYDANDGSITMTQTDNGIAPLTYELLDDSSNPVDPADFNYDPITRTFTGLAPGDYVVQATGTNGCVNVSGTLTINPLTPVTLSIPTTDVVQFGCALGNDPDNASITVQGSSISGGTGSYVRYEFVDPHGQVVQDGKQNKLIVTDFAGGDYTVNVYDDSGCFGSTVVSIGPFDELLAPTVFVDQDIACTNAGENITITAQGSVSDSSTAPHNYSFEQIATSLTNNNGVFTGLQVGLHAFRVTNTVTGCTTTLIHEVEPIQEFRIDFLQDSPVVCAGDSGQNHFEIQGGYSGQFNWTVYQTNGTLADTSDDTPFLGTLSGNGTQSGNIDLPKGTYHIEVVQLDFPFCTENITVTIGGADTVLTASIVEVGNASCSNDQGRLSVVPSGGIAPYTLAIPALGMEVQGVNGHVFTGLASGPHSILVTDAAGCSTTIPATVQSVDPLVATLTPVTQTLDCIGDTDGTIQLALTSGGLGTVRYSLNRIVNGTVLSTSAPQTFDNFGNLGAGTYSVNLTDDAGCTFTTAEVEIADPTEVRAQLELSRGLTCGTTAQLTLRVDGGTPYPGSIYQWSTSPTGPFTDMSGGDTHVFDVLPDQNPYQYYVIDAHGCEPVPSNGIVINALDPLEVDIDLSAALINCHGEGSASVSAKAKGGLGHYSYALFQDAGLTLPVGTPNSNGYFSGLYQGTYFLSVDSGDCTLTSAPLVITEPAPLSVVPQLAHVSCWDGNDGSIVLNTTGGSGNYQYAISPNLNQFDVQNSFTGLLAGDYTVIVQDAQGCYQVLDLTITQPQVLEASVTTVDEVCHGSGDGAVNITVQGGTAPYSSSLNSNAVGDFTLGIMEYNNLPSGDHVVFIRDANGCTTQQIFTIGSGANLAGSVAMEYGCTGNMPTNRLILNMEDPSVVPDLMYALDSNDPNDLVMEADFGNLSPGNHSLTIAHANGCIRTIDFVVEDIQPLTLQLTNPGINQISAQAFGGNPGYRYRLDDGPLTEEGNFLIRRTDTYHVTVTDQNGCSTTQQIYVEFMDIEIPTFFTPDGDGLNDTWKPRNIEIFPKITISVFDRYGRNVYKMLQDTEGWDGFYRESNLPMGDYWYIIKLNGEEDTREFVGHFTLYR